MLYQMQEGTLTLNEEWRDKSVTVLVPKEVAAKGTCLVVTRDALPPGAAFSDYATQQRDKLQQTLTGFRLLLDVAGSIDGRPAQFLEFTWTSHGQPMHQMVMAVQDRSALLNFTASIPGAGETELRERLLEAIRSFKFAPAPDLESA